MQLVFLDCSNDLNLKCSTFHFYELYILEFCQLLCLLLCMCLVLRVRLYFGILLNKLQMSMKRIKEVKDWKFLIGFLSCVMNVVGLKQVF